MRSDVRAPIAASIVSALLLAPLALLAYWIGPTARLDRSLLVHLDRPDGSRSHELFSQVAHLCDPLPFALILAAIVAIGVGARRIRETVVALVLVAGATLTTQVLKQLLDHSRFEIQYGLHQPLSDAFPSGHATAAAALAAALLLVVPPRLRPLAAGAGAAFAGAVGIAVVVIQWHYPSDVVGGLLVVASWTFAAIAALRLLSPRGPEGPPRERSETASGRFAVSLQ
ncbi:MAG: phosphatase PAP2 family protein [Solirubrobacterales bacterium]